jgi:hypothetical protein
MKDAGLGLIIVGLLAIVGGFFITVSRSIGYPVGEVANLHAMHVQSLVFHGGFFAFLSGAVLFAGGSIVNALQGGSATHVDHPAARPPEQHVPEQSPQNPEWAGVPPMSSFEKKLLIGVAIFGVIALGALYASGALGR